MNPQEGRMSDTLTEHIVKTPGTVGGRARLVGHRIRVMDIVVWHEMRGYSPDEIAAMFPGITLADVHAALTYYFDHRPEIESELREDEQAVKEILTRHPSKVREKLGG